MKKVRKADLVNLIAQYYCDFIKLMPVTDIVKGNNGVSINVNSIYICVIDHNEFDSKRDKENLMEKFAEQIEAITFGNLKVTYKGCRIKDNSFLSWMYIANAYEVVE